MTDMVYDNTVDSGAFRVAVERIGDYRGRFTVAHQPSGDVLLDEEVGLSYGAIFGPDVADVDEWQGRAIGVIDGWYASHGQTPPTGQVDD